MPRLILGGSFNPIHHGHLACSRTAAESLGFDGVILIPSARPPHKAEPADMASAADRLIMAQSAVVNDRFFSVDDVELRRDGPSYTLDTARELVARGAKQVHWLIGADMLLYLPKWHKPMDLLREVHFVVMARPGWNMDWEAIPPEYRHLRENVVQVPQIDISASAIRARVAAGRSIRYLTPDAVCDYIRDRRLYSATGVVV